MISRFADLERRIERLLAEHPAGVSEHTLIRQLAGDGWKGFADARLADELQLFRVHFLLFHLLYRLRDRLRDEKRGELQISPLNIVLGPYEAGYTGLTRADPLREYYLDLDNLEIGRREVRHLLEGFWRRLGAADEREEALAFFELAEPVDFPTIKRRYRVLAMRHHPDRGGDTEMLQRLNRAMAVLERAYG